MQWVFPLRKGATMVAGRKFRGRIINNAPMQLPDTPIERCKYVNTDAHRFYSLSVSELQSLARTAVGCPIKLEHEPGIMGSITNMVVNASDGTADVEFELDDTEAGKIGRTLISRDFTGQLSLSHRVTRSGIQCMEVSLVKKGAREGTFIEHVVDATSKTGITDTSTLEHVIYKTVISHLECSPSSSIEIMASTDAPSGAPAGVVKLDHPSTTPKVNGAYEQPPGQPQQQQQQQQGQEEKKAPVDKSVEERDVEDDVDMDGESDDPTADAQRALDAIREMPMGKERTQALRATNRLIKQQELLLEERNRARQAELVHKTGDKYAPFLNQLGMSKEKQVELVKGLVSAKSSSAMLAKIQPLIDAASTALQNASSQQRQPMTSHTLPFQAGHHVQVNASEAEMGQKRRRTEDQHEEEVMATFLNARKRREAQEAYVPLYMGGSSPSSSPSVPSVAVNASGSAPSSNPNPPQKSPLELFTERTFKGMRAEYKKKYG